MISATEADWSRERIRAWWDPGRRLLRAARKWQKASQGRGFFAFLRRKYWSATHHFWSVVTGASIPVNTSIGGGLLMPHPIGIVIHPDAVIGPNCLLMQHVTLGVSGNEKKGAPRLGGHVDVGAGACVLGPVIIGDHAKIGANAVVLCNVPAGATAVGVPARVLPCNESTAETGSLVTNGGLL